jgi:hypothetical protein
VAVQDHAKDSKSWAPRPCQSRYRQLRHISRHWCDFRWLWQEGGRRQKIGSNLFYL